MAELFEMAIGAWDHTAYIVAGFQGGDPDDFNRFRQIRQAVESDPPDMAAKIAALKGHLPKWLPPG